MYNTYKRKFLCVFCSPSICLLQMSFISPPFFFVLLLLSCSSTPFLSYYSISFLSIFLFRSFPLYPSHFLPFLFLSFLSSFSLTSLLSCPTTSFLSCSPLPLWWLVTGEPGLRHWSYCTAALPANPNPQCILIWVTPLFISLNTLYTKQHLSSSA